MKYLQLCKVYEISITNISRMKELGMSETIIKRKEDS